MPRRSEIDLRAEFAQADLGDKRLSTRLDRLVSVLEAAPDRSFPSAMRSDAELEAAYRFFQNARVTLDALIGPHLTATARRAAGVGSVIVAHDTTEFRFEGMKRRDGLGQLGMKGQGFFGHFAFAVADDNVRTPLGVIGALTYTRDHGPPRRTERLSYSTRKNIPRESARWSELVRDVDERMPELKVVHVMDREADDFPLLALMAGGGHRFVIRMTASRRRKVLLDGATTYLVDAMEQAPIVVAREVNLSARPGKRGGRSEQRFPVRDRRLAKLTISAATMDLAPPRDVGRDYGPLRLSVVRVCEPSPPTGEDPVEWLLVSNEPIDSPEQVLRVVDTYRARWIIEEYFKALKTGCAMERRQLESLDGLLAALGIFVPIAARLLLLRTAARTRPTSPASSVLTDDELLALKTIGRVEISRSPTTREALLAVAALGGHLKRNGEPGWLVLARGFEKLDVAAQVVASMSLERTKK